MHVLLRIWLLLDQDTKEVVFAVNVSLCVCVFVIWSVALIAGEGGGGLAVSPDERGGMGGGGGTLSRHTNTNHMQLFSVSLRGT